jgi:hypothetical protein
MVEMIEEESDEDLAVGERPLLKKSEAIFSSG